MTKHTSYLRQVNVNSLFKINRFICFFAVLLSTFLVNNKVIAQSISCHGQLNVSLNANCEYEVTPEVVSSAALPNAASAYTIMLTDHYNAAVVGAILDGTHLGQTMTVKLIDNGTTNSCWGKILVEDKIAPTCQDETVDVICLDMDEYLPAVADNCDPDPSVVQIGQTITISDCDGDDYIKIIERTYQAEDHGGYRSTPCTQILRILRLKPADFDFPADFTDDLSLVCGSDFPLDADGHPSPDTTGIPTFTYTNPAGVDTLLSLYPNIKDLCKARIEYTDFVVGKDGCLTKIMREWSYIDACSDYDDIFVHTQAIWIRDTKAPELVCSHPITVVGNPIPGQNNAHGWGVGNANCQFSVNIPPVTGSDNCSGIVRYEVLIDDVLMLTKNGGTINIAADTFELKYVGFDGCGSSDTCVTELVVLDSAAPVAVCDRHTVIGLTQDGTVEVEAFVFDDGSFDDCGIQKMHVARMGDPICDTLDLDFGPSITFCCADIGFENMVAFRVWDFTGRHNTCMVTVEIQDKTGPNVDCPADVRVDCDHPMDLTDLSEFGSASANNQCETVLTELDPIVDIGACNNGTITRRWSVSDIGGDDACEQVITISDPYDFSFENLDSILLRPRDIDTTGACGLDLLPDNLPPGAQRPILLGGPCDLIGASYEDEEFIFDNGGGACLKILRNWTILNWCAVDSSHTAIDERKLNVAQIIKVTNTIGPDVTLGDNQDEICTFDNDCTDGPITLTASATDDCSVDLRALIFLDAFNDGTIDDTLNISVSNSGRTTTATISSTFPIGEHRAIFTFIDDCNNVSSKEQVFTIKNCKAPTCALIDGLRLSLQVMDTDGDGNPDNEMACIWASDFDASSVSACGGDLSFFFNEDKTMPEMCFSCCDIGRNLVDVYVFDEFGNKSFCTTSVTIDDHNDVNFCRLTASCPDIDVTVRDCGASTEPSALGQPSIGDGCACSNLSIPFDDVITTTTDGCRLITRTWSVSCDGSYIDDCVQRITVRNDVAPQIINCPGHITMNLGGSTACEAFINLSQPSANAGCNDEVTITHNSAFADMQGANASGTYPVGTTQVTFTASNECGRRTTCTTSITVRDNNDPVCNPRDITITLRDDGEFTVSPRQLDNGSEDSCGDVFTAGSNMTFDCDDAGTTQPTVYFIEDESGNRIQCTANVTINPVDGGTCNARDITVRLRTNGSVTVDPTTLHQGSGGACGDVNITGNPVSFDCCDAGTTRSVSYFINGTTECTANVTIDSERAPQCDDNDITISLNANGVVNVNPQSLYDGPDGICFDLGGPTNVQFDCDEAGTTQVVTYTLTDECDGAVTSCPVNVTINPEGQAVCNARDITVSLGTNGTVTVDPVTLHQGGNSGVCGGGANITGVPVTYDCCDAGSDRTITYTINGTLNCNATVTITPEAAPTCNSDDITVSLNANGVVNINPRSLYQGTDGLCFDIGGSTNVTFDCDEAGTTQQVSYTLIDECDNSVTTCNANVTINPEGQPECNAQNITVTLDNSGSVTVDPTTLHQGGGAGVCGNVSLSGAPVTYDCCDAGETRTITYIINGTVNCNASVTINPEAEAVCNSNDVTVSLNANGVVDIDPSTLFAGQQGKCFSLSSANVRFDCSNAGTTQSVNYVLTRACDASTLDCTANVTIEATEDIMITCPNDVTVDCGTDVSDLDVFGTATASDGCGGASMTPTESVVSNLGVCGMGVITRTFVASDGNGNSEECVQIINVSGPSNPVTEADITWPTSPSLVSGCGGAAPIDGRPIVNTSNAECSNITMSSVDSDLVINANTACEGNVIRTWTVIDSCQLNAAGAGIFTFQQVFEFTDEVDPIVNVPANVTVNSTGDNCEANVTVDLATATDNCDPNPTITNNSPFADTNNSGNVSGIYPVGTHVVDITATDRCGNTTTESITITVTGGTSNSFSFECKKRIIRLNDNQTATVHIDTIVCITQACNGSYTASFSRTDVNETTMVFDCSDRGAINGFMSYIYLNGVLVDSCTTIQEIEAAQGICSSPLGVSDVSGFIRTESGDGLKAASIALQGSEFRNLSTDENGYYAFPPITNGGSYTVVPEKDDDHLNGVSTLDLIMIQKHILGLDLLDSPYKLIAADINNSQSLSVADIVQLRKLILGIYDELPDNTSWKAIDADFEFDNDQNPFASNLPEEYDIVDLQSDMEVDFVGVKVGDVNQSAKTVNGKSSEVRSNSNLTFEVSSYEDPVGQAIYEFRSENYNEIDGFQFTLDLARSGSFVDIRSGKLNITEDNVGLRYVSKGLVSVSYHESDSRTIDSDEVLFTVVLKPGNLNSNPFSINNSITAAEAYGKDIYGITAEFDQQLFSTVTDLYQNNPNPWAGETQIEFVLPESMKASISVYDIAGRILFRVQEPFKKGTNVITLNREDLSNYSGVAYYELVTKDVKLIRSMILID